MSVWKGGVWGSQQYPNGGGPWRGGLWHSQRSSSQTATEALRQSLFGNGQPGAFYVSQPTVDGQQVLFQDVEGNVPVTTNGQLVGLLRDISGNNYHAKQPTESHKPIYRTNGVSHWIEFDGVNDKFILDARSLSYERFFQMANASVEVTDNQFFTSWTSDLFVTYMRRVGASYYDGAVKGVEVPSTSASSVFGVRLDGTSNTGVVYENGATVFTGTYSTVNVSGEGYIAGTGGTSGYSAASVYGLLFVVNDDVTENSRNEAQHYLASLSGITL